MMILFKYLALISVNFLGIQAHAQTPTNMDACTSVLRAQSRSFVGNTVPGNTTNGRFELVGDSGQFIVHAHGMSFPSEKTPGATFEFDVEYSMKNKVVDPRGTFKILADDQGRLTEVEETTHQKRGALQINKFEFAYNNEGQCIPQKSSSLKGIGD